MTINEIIPKIISKVDMSTIEMHTSHSHQKKLVYTSFDGDYMHFLQHMLKFAQTNGYLPINPESALGYYVSTTTHGGSKVPVMKDCIKTESICDEMWIFNPKDGHIPEGVLAEMMVWLKTKNTDIKIIPFFDKFKTVLDTNTPINLEQYTYSRTNIESYISTRKESDINEIKSKLFDSLDNQPSAYIVANFFNYKHIDWTRSYCYLNGYCPISPQNIMPYYLYKTCLESVDQQYLIDRLTLLDRCDKLLWFTNTANFASEIDCLDMFSCTELYYWFNYKDPKDICIIDWKDAGVPKYANKERWALTKTEVSEIVDSSEKNARFRNLIQEYEKQIKDEFNIFKGDLLGKDECEFIKNDMNAFLFGLISDQSVKAELAWSLPYRLKQRLGQFDLQQIAEMQISDLEKTLKEKPALHRYPSNIAKYLIAASQLLLDCYNGDASNIWSKGTSAAEIVKRLESFKGISHKKAALGSLLLVRDLGIEIADKENINLAYDIHIRRICLRTGLSDNDTLDNVIAAGKKIFPDFPGRLTSSFWAIGRDICRPSDPQCSKCPLDQVCDHNISLGGDIHA